MLFGDLRDSIVIVVVVEDPEAAGLCCSGDDQVDRLCTSMQASPGHQAGHLKRAFHHRWSDRRLGESSSIRNEPRCVTAARRVGQLEVDHAAGPDLPCHRELFQLLTDFWQLDSGEDRGIHQVPGLAHFSGTRATLVSSSRARFSRPGRRKRRMYSTTVACAASCLRPASTVARIVGVPAAARAHSRRSSSISISRLDTAAVYTNRAPLYTSGQDGADARPKTRVPIGTSSFRRSTAIGRVGRQSGVRERVAFLPRGAGRAAFLEQEPTRRPRGRRPYRR